MSITLEAIEFNHNPTDPNSPSLNLRKSGTEFIQIPEWQRGITTTPDQSIAAYIRSKSVVQPITIRAKFSSSDPLFDVTIRAINATASDGGVLGAIDEQTVDFGFGFQTDFETLRLDHSSVANARVGASIVTWRWQARVPPSPTFMDVGITSHKIYVVLEAPKDPWQQLPFVPNNVGLPWIDVLDVACRWARGTGSLDEAAALITKSVNDLGSGVLQYDELHGAPHYSIGEFLCEDFLELLRGGTGKGKLVNCSDCATIVSTFANILGCKLSQSQMGLEGSGFDINFIKRIGASVFRPGGFSFHEVAWKGTCDVNDEVFDACLNLDNDGNPMAAPHQALLPINLRFGNSGDGLYRDLLAQDTAVGRPKCKPQPHTSTHRRIRNPLAPEPLAPTDASMDFLSQKFLFADWQGLNALRENLLVWNFDLSDIELPGLILSNSVEANDDQRSIHSIETLWTKSGAEEESLISIVFYECGSREIAHRFLLELVGLFSLPVLARVQTNVGDVAFASPSNTAVLFARANMTILLIDVSKEPESVLEVAALIDGIIAAKPLDSEVRPALSDANLSIPYSGTYCEGEAIPLLSDARAAKQGGTSYRFFSASGNFRIAEGSPYFEPEKAGDHSLLVTSKRAKGLFGANYQFSISLE